MNDAAPSPFGQAVAAVAQFGITLQRSPGEFCINYRDGGEATADALD
jgi:hypothetical protein